MNYRIIFSGIFLAKVRWGRNSEILIFAIGHEDFWQMFEEGQFSQILVRPNQNIFFSAYFWQKWVHGSVHINKEKNPENLICCYRLCRFFYSKFFLKFLYDQTEINLKIIFLVAKMLLTKLNMRKYSSDCGKLILKRWL